MTKKFIESKKPEVNPEVQAVIEATNKFFEGGGANSLKDENRYYVMLKLFDPDLLELITQLDKEKIELMTKHDTLAESMRLLGGLSEEEAKPFTDLKDTMQDRYMLYQISKGRQSRKEVVDVLKDTMEHTVRTIGDKMRGKGP